MRGELHTISLMFFYYIALPYFRAFETKIVFSERTVLFRKCVRKRVVFVILLALFWSARCLSIVSSARLIDPLYREADADI
jgi:hypothetical protein